jgi:hypothetical protein
MGAQREKKSGRRVKLQGEKRWRLGTPGNLQPRFILELRHESALQTDFPPSTFIWGMLQTEPSGQNQHAYPEFC